MRHRQESVPKVRPKSSKLTLAWEWNSNNTTEPPCAQVSAQQQEEIGFCVTNGTYILRPGISICTLTNGEFMESLFYAYRMTGDVIYQDRAWQAFQHITAATEAKFGYTAIQDVMTMGGPVLDDEETFWLAETLKYLFLIFDDPERLSLDDWVFNTEAHPLRRGGRSNFR